jgi:DNA replication protein DnaC
MAHELDQYDGKALNGIFMLQLTELRELLWLDQKFNLMLIGPSGVGKTFIASGLCFDSLKNGYHSLFRTIDQLTRTIKLKELSTMEGREYKCLLKDDLLVIDDIMMFPMEKEIAVGLFQLINQLHEKTSFIITINKNPK